MLILRPVVLSNENDLVTAFLNAMSLLIYYYVYDTDEQREIGLKISDHEKLLVANLNLAKPIAKKLGIPDRDWNTLISLYTTREYMKSNKDDSILKRLAERFKRLIKDESFADEQKSYLKDWSLLMRQEDVNTPAERRIKRFVGSITSPDVAKYFPAVRKTDIDEQKRLSKSAETLRKKIEKGGELDKSHKQYDEYMKTNRDARALSKKIMYDFIRQNGGKVDAEKVRDHLDKLGVNHSIPEGFIGLIGEENKYYTKFGEELGGIPGGKVRMNKTYKEGSPNWYLDSLSYQSRTGKPQKIYTKKAMLQGKQKKFANVHIFIDKMEEHKKAWRRYLMKKQLSKFGKGSREKQCAIIIEIMYLTSARVGTKGNKTDGKNTYGVLTMLNKHLTVRGDVVKIAYVGKKASKVKMTFDIKNASSEDKKYLNVVIDYLKKSKLEGRPDEQVFEFNDANFLRKFMSSKLGMSIGPHGFRHVRGTLMMANLIKDAMKRLGKKPKDESVLKAFDNMTKEIGEQLGHYTTGPSGEAKITGLTAIKSYIDPSLILNFFGKFSHVKPPASVKRLQKMMKVD